MERSNGSVPALLDDQLVIVAEQAERRVEAVKKIKILALKVTNPYDWVDQNGKPYLQASGAEKVARLFGICWKIEGGERQELENGHFSFSFQGEFRLSGAEIEAIGSRSSTDKFFSTRYKWDEGKQKKLPYELPPSEIDQGNVKKAAYTNCIGNGITRLLGIRNMKWEEIEDVCGFGKQDVTSIQYGLGSAPKDKKTRKSSRKAPKRDDQPPGNGNVLGPTVKCPDGGPCAGDEVSVKYCQKMCKRPGPDKCDPYKEITKPEERLE